MKPQCEELLQALRLHPMTTGEIRSVLGIGMPATRVFELRELGHPIVTENIQVPTRHGKPARVARYSLVKGRALNG
jgi:hypothetical protein